MEIVKATRGFQVELSSTLAQVPGHGDAFTGAAYRQWCQAPGFREVEVLPLAGPASAAVAQV